jgi:hypothetical protein
MKNPKEPQQTNVIGTGQPQPAGEDGVRAVLDDSPPRSDRGVPAGQQADAGKPGDGEGRAER